jgi:hypothetical protein
LPRFARNDGNHGFDPELSESAGLTGMSGGGVLWGQLTVSKEQLTGRGINHNDKTMPIGEPAMPTAEEQAKIKDERVLSDAELIKSGARTIVDAETGQGRLEVTQKQLSNFSTADRFRDSEIARQENFEEEKNERLSSLNERYEHEKNEKGSFFYREIADLTMPFLTLGELKKIRDTLSSKSENLNRGGNVFKKLNKAFKEVVAMSVSEYYSDGKNLEEIRKIYSKDEVEEFLESQSLAISRACDFTRNTHELCPQCVLSGFSEEELDSRIKNMEILNDNSIKHPRGKPRSMYPKKPINQSIS